VDLPPLAQRYLGVLQGRLALRAVAGTMLHHLVGCRHQMQRLPTMSDLPTRLLAALRPQALGLAFQPVTTRRFGAVVAILRQPRLQRLHALQQRPHLLPQRGVLRFQLSCAFFCHASMLRPLCKSA
jgi:hypothetical protein